ncbi:hypothetical protein BRC93_09415 [Halobacteriales archaeon QS_5_70_15]|nr:MAG: hypothetical protein BRC93_09415 [Halobacteriales archaeon QS_5_70_15]
MRCRLWPAAFAVLLLVGAAGGPAAGVGGGLGAEGGTGAEVDPDRVVMEAAVEADGDARWRVAYRFRLSDENATAAFEAFRADVEANAAAYRERFADRMGRTVRAAENATGREMAVRNVSVRTSREELTAYGVVTYRFRWTGFAAVSGDRLLVGDALEGLYLDRRTTLVVARPDGYRASGIEPVADRRHEDSVAWIGPTEFGSGEPRLVLEPDPAVDGTAAASGTTATNAGGTTGTPVDRSDDRGGALPVGGVALGGALLALGLGAGAALTLASRREETAAAESGADDGAAGPAVDESLAPPDERVLTLLRTEGGRMKQAQVAERLDWTAAKTSRVVSDLREAEEVETFRVGRENVVALPED